MQRFRIGETFAIKWAILTNGEPVPLAGRDLTLVLHTPRYADIIVEFEPDLNAALFTITPEMQKQLGVYSLTMFENFRQDGQALIDYCNAFELVATTCERNNGCKCLELSTSCMDLGYVGGAVRQYDSKYEFPNVGDSHILYVDKSANKSYRWDSSLLKYYCVGADYNDIEIIDSGDADGLHKEIE